MVVTSPVFVSTVSIRRRVTSPTSSTPQPPNPNILFALERETVLAGAGDRIWSPARVRAAVGLRYVLDRTERGGALPVEDEPQRVSVPTDIPERGAAADIADHMLRELLNYRDAFEFVSTYLNDGGPITERFILEIHRHLVSDVRGGSAAPGQYRRVQNYVVNSATGETPYTPPRDVPLLMRELVIWLNRPSDIHPVIASEIAQFQLVHIHPFLDGNGRTSRLLSTLCLYRAGYDFKRLFTISEYYDRDRMAFYQALQSVRRTNMDMTSWIEFFTIGLATQLTEVKRRGELAIQQDILARRHDLTGRQVLALRHVLESGRVTIGEFEHLCPGIQRRTLQRDLRGLMEKGLLLRRGSTNRLEYVLADGVA